MKINDRPDPESGDMAHLHDYPVDHNIDGGDKALGCVLAAIGLVMIIASVWYGLDVAGAWG